MKNIIQVNKQLFLSSAAPAGFLIAGNLFLYQPAFIYHYNKIFLYYKFADFLLFLIPIFSVFFVLLSLPAIGRKTWWRKCYTVLLIGIAISMWMATMLKGSQGELDGKNFALITYPNVLWFNGLLLLFVGAIAAILAWFHLKYVNFFLLLVNITAMIFLIEIIFVPGNAFENNAAYHISAGTQDLVTFSKKKNVLLILLDTFQSDFFAKILEKNPNLASEFSGFTYFKKAVSVSPTTYLAIPTIHSGVVYKKGDSVSAFYKDALAHSFTVLHQHHGYRSFILNPYLSCPKDVNWSTQEKIYNPRRAELAEASLLVDIALFKMVPNFCKNFIYNDGKWFTRNLILGDIPPWAVISNAMLSIMASKMNTESPIPTLKFIHSFATHPPTVLDQYGKRKEGCWNRENAINQDTYALTLVTNLLQSLKDHHVYDVSAIMIIGDHGASLPQNGGTILTSSGSPLFLFKPINAHGKLNVSDKLVGLVDIPATLCAATKDCGNISFNGYDVMGPEHKDRKFKFNYYVWHRDYFNGKENSGIQEFEISGNPTDVASWKKCFSVALPPLKDDLLIGKETFFNYCGVGWSVEENTHRWAEGPIADLYLPLPLNKDAHLEFTAATHDLNKGQKISVWSNNIFIGKFALPPNKQSVIHLTIPASAIVETPTRLIFRFEQWNKPSNGDPRDLAAMFLGTLKID